jgi:serine/threonine protein kinase
VKIGDFGIAKRVREGDATELRTATGTQGYEAPEIRGYVEVDEQNPSSVYTNVVDIWSFGCVIYKVAAKQVPFRTGRDIKRFCDKKIPFPAEQLRGKLTTDGIEFLQSVLVPEPLDRPTADVALQHPWLVPDEAYTESHLWIETESANNEEPSIPLKANTMDTVMPVNISESQEYPGTSNAETQSLTQKLASQQMEVVNSGRSKTLFIKRDPALESERLPEPRRSPSRERGRLPEPIWKRRRLAEPRRILSWEREKSPEPSRSPSRELVILPLHRRSPSRKKERFVTRKHEGSSMGS